MMSNRSRDDFDRLMTGWMEAEGRVREPEDLVERVLDRTRVARRRPRWLVADWWYSMLKIARLPVALRPAPLLTAAIALLLILGAAAAIALFAGSQQRRLPAPFGLAANGQIAVVANGHIAVSNVDGSGRHVITSGTETQSVPVFSRDGTRIAYIEGPPLSTPDAVPSTCLMTANVDGSHPVSIDPHCDGMSPPSWSPDDRFLVYSRGYAPDIEQVFVAAADGSSPPVRVSDATVHSWGPGWSPDARTLSFVGTDASTGDQQIWLVDVDGAHLRRLTLGPWAFVDGASQWRADGSMLAFSARADGERSTIWTAGLDGHLEKVPVRGPRAKDTPAWSPDGTRLAYLAHDSPNVVRIHVLTLASGADVELDGTFSPAPIGWSPDGRRVFITDVNNGAARLVILDPTGSAPSMSIDAGLASTSVAADPWGASWQRLGP